MLRYCRAPLPKPDYRLKWLVVGLVPASLALAGFVLRRPVASWLEGKRICDELRAGNDLGQLFYFSDSRQDDVLKQLAPGKYRMRVTSDCYTGTCTFEVSESPWRPATKDPCRGQGLTLHTWGWGEEWNYLGFSLPAALDWRRVHIVMERDGRTLWKGAPHQDCSAPGFCVDYYPELAPDAENTAKKPAGSDVSRRLSD